jgi:hypothetical protein
VIELINELVVTSINWAVAVSVTVVDIVRIVINCPVTVVVTSCRPENPVSIDVIRERSVRIRVPIIRRAPVSIVIVRVSVWGMVIVAVSHWRITKRTMVVT